MDTFNNESTPITDLTITSQMKSYLAETSKWGKFLAIMGYISVGMMVVLGIIMITSMTMFTEGNPVFGMHQMGYFYFILAVVYYFPVRYLHKFCSDISSAVSLNDMHTLESGFENLKSLFKFVGILTIVMMSLYMLVIVGMFIFFGTMFT